MNHSYRCPSYQYSHNVFFCCTGDSWRSSVQSWTGCWGLHPPNQWRRRQETEAPSSSADHQEIHSNCHSSLVSTASQLSIGVGSMGALGAAWSPPLHFLKLIIQHTRSLPTKCPPPLSNHVSTLILASYLPPPLVFKAKHLKCN